MQLYMINLDRSPERWQTMETNFADQGLELTRVKAVDMQTLDPQIYQAAVEASQARLKLVKGEVACS